MSMVKYLETGKTEDKPMSGTLFDQLQADILTRKLKPGSKLTEQKICDTYNVSRTPVREALRQLEADSLIETKPNRGAYVIGFTDQDISDMFYLRATYEIQAVKWAIERITDHEMEQLSETFEFMEFYTIKNDIDKMLEINTAFHQIIYGATHNKMLQKMLTSYQLYSKHCNPSNYYAPNYLSNVFKEHQAIFEAFAAHDTEGGALAMTQHMTNSRGRKFK